MSFQSQLPKSSDPKVLRSPGALGSVPALSRGRWGAVPPPRLRDEAWGLEMLRQAQQQLLAGRLRVMGRVVGDGKSLKGRELRGGGETGVMGSFDAGRAGRDGRAGMWGRCRVRRKGVGLEESKRHVKELRRTEKG